MAEPIINIPWDEWKCVKLLGHGAFGQVYEIQKDVLGITEYAAVKVLSVPESQEEIDALYSKGHDFATISTHFKEYLKDIVNEYSIMLDLKSHANVVYCEEVRYIPHEDGIGWDVFIKMELLKSLDKVVGNEYNEENVIQLGKDLCNALIYCEKKHIIHRDIKPQNIFISESGSYKLGDFGVAKISDKTATGTTTGTYEYMAPEVFKIQQYGSRVDVYSLGLVMYWMMNQKCTPFLPLPPQIPSARDKESARLRRMNGEKLPAPVNGSEQLKSIVLKACAYDPKDRYQSAQEMREALECLSRGERTVKQRMYDEQETVVKKPDVLEKTVLIVEGKPDDPEKTVFEFSKNQENTSKMDRKQIGILAVIAGCLVAVSVLCIAVFAKPKCEHNWVNATCINPKFCEKCGEEVGITAAHTWIAATTSAPKTCSDCGFTVGSALPNSRRAEIEEKIKNTDLAHIPESLYDEPVEYVCVIKEGVMRRGHGFDYRQIGGALEGETVYVYAIESTAHGKWYFVENVRGKIGWAAFEMKKKN